MCYLLISRLLCCCGIFTPRKNFVKAEMEFKENFNALFSIALSKNDSDVVKNNQGIEIKLSVDNHKEQMVSLTTISQHIKKLNHCSSEIIDLLKISNEVFIKKLNFIKESNQDAIDPKTFTVRIEKINLANCDSTVLKSFTSLKNIFNALIKKTIALRFEQTETSTTIQDNQNSSDDKCESYVATYNSNEPF